ncbi:hypothetical protein N5D36_10525 [Pseudomonas mosselii]|uniref:Iron-containing redox enzyme family protein n=1 Tax=Pseudomonas mosselii TaxID=78327 RepID=A0ABX9B0E9_9PSED|nr:hypothetical protein [Pseudomonas mosselii]MDH0627793.1 hypothetical protein [Pseudomonas mosselii]MDH0677882.1 hypothetical protein [Pseudomonas mosselii]MDH0925961.1 hypothetical protein [Pseudomonas mosselii]MDH1134416.1 hypothetical protein [Pseudomonas mosselii]MDH1140635.1 hypothetical protein [Pseudomonas mosselii]
MNVGNDPIMMNEYQIRITAAREKFAAREEVQALFKAPMDAPLVNLFMIYWSAMSAALTTPIPEYLATAGVRCEALGLSRLAEFFKEHTEEEDGHHEWAAADVHKLVSLWNAKYPGMPINTEDLLVSNLTPSVRRYHQLHKDVVAGDAPWAELAIDVEIELITTQYGPALLKACAAALCEEGQKSISFLAEHVRFDFGHTDTNFRVVAELIEAKPEYTQHLVAIGEQALTAYGDFLGEALQLARQAYARLPHAQVAADA